MSWWRSHWLGSLGSLVLAVSASSAIAAPTPVPFMADVDTWTVTSEVSHSTYQVWVARPEGYSRQHVPYPVLYVGDAKAVFGIAVETAYLLSPAKQIPPVVVVKPGHGFHANWVGRFLDFTPPIDKAQAYRVLNGGWTSPKPLPLSMKSISLLTTSASSIQSPLLLAPWDSASISISPLCAVTGSTSCLVTFTASAPEMASASTGRLKATEAEANRVKVLRRMAV